MDLDILNNETLFEKTLFETSDISMSFSSKDILIPDYSNDAQKEKDTSGYHFQQKGSVIKFYYDFDLKMITND